MLTPIDHILITVIIWVMMALIGYLINANKILISIWFCLLMVGSLNSFYYLHLFDNILLYYRVRAYSIADYLPALSGLLLGYFIKHIDVFAVKVLLPIHVVVSGYFILIPWAKPLTSPLVLSGPENFVSDGKIIQRTNSTCGPCSLVKLLDINGIVVSEDQISKLCYTSSSGTEIWYIARIARSMGFLCEFSFNKNNVFGSSIAGMSSGGLGHFVSVLKVDDDSVYYHDSLIGNLTVKKSDFLKRYTGFSLIIKRI